VLQDHIEASNHSLQSRRPPRHDVQGHGGGAANPQPYGDASGFEQTGKLTGGQKEAGV
jgi:hypothetical protein